ncbi:MAG: sensor histidine kinase [Spirochaetota bacterium]
MEFGLHSVRDVCTAAERRLEAQFAGKEIELTLDAPDDLPRVRMDDERILQVLINLLGNALQYTEPGGQVRLQAEAADGSVVITVADTGVGLDPSDLTRIFERFYRVDKSRSRPHGGSRIGLAVSRHIVRAHGGRIWAESSGPGLGSRFGFGQPLS